MKLYMTSLFQQQEILPGISLVDAMMAATIIILFLSILGGVLLILFLVRSHKNGRLSVSAAGNPNTGKSKKKKDTKPLGYLKVLSSENGQLIGKKFSISSAHCGIGRGARNEIVLMEDVSLHDEHAEILYVEGRFLIHPFTNGIQGLLPRPEVFVNEKAIGENYVPLQSGDIIRLGKVVKLVFMGE